MGAKVIEPRLNLRTTIVLPAYNEAQTIQSTISAFHEAMPNAKIFVIDNASTDKTGELAQSVLNRFQCGEVLHESAKGKGNAVRKAFNEIDSDIYVMADADMTYPAGEIQKLIDPIVNESVDVCVGDRHSKGDYGKENKRPLHDFGNRFIRYLVNRLYGVSLKDILSGYRVFSRRFVKNWPVMNSGFEIEIEMTLHALDKRFKIQEIPISYKDRPKGSSSKLNTFKDGMLIIKTLVTIFKDYKPFHFFGSLAAIFAGSGFGFGSVVLLEFYETQFITHIPLAILSTGLMIISFVSLSIGLVLSSISNYQRLNFEHRLLGQSK